MTTQPAPKPSDVESGHHGKNEETLDEPVLDGAQDHSEHGVDPRKGMSDPALIRDVAAGTKTVNPYG